MSDPAADPPASFADPPDAAGSAPPPMLLAGLLVEQHDCWQRGERVLVEAYLERYPVLRNDPGGVLDLLYNEFVAREACGEAPRPEEYCARFPDLAPIFRAQVQFHRAFSPEGPSRATLAQGPHSGELTKAPAQGAGGPLPHIPGYEVLGELGRGGMGVVYKAWQLHLERVVALKMILSGAYAGAHEFARFQTEARSAARLQHPHIVQIHEVGEHDGRPYLTLEFVDGGSLAQMLGGRPLAAGPAAQLVHTLARAMHYAHERGVVHRDLKPANVLLTADGAPKITDFGLARCLGWEAAQTQPDVILGTPCYMAPEQAGGQVRQVGPYTDVYSLGAILYELLTGRPPFMAETALGTLEQVRGQEPVPPARLQPKVPRDLETICLKCLHKEPEKRYASAAALAEDLELFLSDRPIRARRTSLPDRTWRWGRRNPAVAGLLGSVALLLVMIAAGSSVLALMLGRQRDEARDLLRRARDAEAENNELFDSYLAQSGAVRSGPQIGQRHRSLEALAKVAARRPSLELRNDAIAFMMLTDLRKTRDRAVAPAGVPATASVFNASLERHAWSDARGNITVRSVLDDRIINHLPGSDSPGQTHLQVLAAQLVMSLMTPTQASGMTQLLAVKRFQDAIALQGSQAWVLQFSPNGRFLAAKHHRPTQEFPNLFRVWDVEAGKIILEIPFDICDRACAFSADNRRLAVGGHEAGIWLYDLQGDNQGRRLAKVAKPDRLAFDPTGRKLAVGLLTGEVQVRDVADGKLLFNQPHPRWSHALAWHPDGKRLAVGCTDFQVYVWDVTAQEEPLTLRGHEAEVQHVVFSHGGNLLASNGWDGNRLWDPWTGKQLLFEGGGVGPQFSADDRVMGLAGSNVSLWEITAAPECRTLHGHWGYKGPWCVGYSPDGRLLVSASYDGVRIWDATLAREIAFLPEKDPGARSAFVDPPGRQLTQLLVAHDTGLDRWPITDPGGAGGGLQIGPVQSLVPTGPGRENRACLAADGRTLAFGDYNQGKVFILDLEKRPPENKTLLGGLGGVARVAISPDGHWVAGASDFLQGSVRVWDRDTRAVSKDLPFPLPGSALAFSPDNKWLVISTPDEYSFWKVGSWEPGLVIRPGSSVVSPTAFSRDGSVLAVSHRDRSVRLVDPATGKEIATLTAPNPGMISWLCFSPDGGQLAVATSTQTIQLWDLRLIRSQLAKINLDWDPLAYPPAPPNPEARPLSATVLTKNAPPRP